MGVPKFFRWCAERYPNITRNLGNYAPPMDNLYLDVNGIIHNCTHPNDVDVLKRAPTEKEMIHGIFLYLERLFNAVQPRKHFMVAVDGVAPRAKMNQQRQRRYRAGYEMMVAREEAVERGEEVPEETAVFDSNCITPGTPFMVLVSEKIQYFLAMKVSTDPAWQKCKIIYSGHDCPGEGEHKIVDFVRRRKMEPGYSPHETHCMYGLDADLVMLALTTHEPRFVLLREEVTFGTNQGNNKNNQNGRGGNRSEMWKEDTRLMTNHTFVLLDIGLLRDYLELEIREICLASQVAPNHNLERFFDDFVFTCFFIGNDFLPSIPTVGINDDSIIQMLEVYVREVRSKNGYLTHHGKIQWNHVEQWLNALGKTEMDVIRKRQQEEEQFQKRRARNDQSHEVKSSLDKTFENITEYKEHFYRSKHHMDGYRPTCEEMRELRKHYIEGLTWVMDYYYQGPPSWKWFFPHYYAPMASDLIGLMSLGKSVQFDSSQPFLPHQQLLAVLPPMSYRCLPPAYWPLLKSKNSPLAGVFPDHIEIDREGTRAAWEGIVLIPFIEEDQLLEAYHSVQHLLSEEDRRHNKLGPPLEIFYDPNARNDLLDNMFPPLRDIHVRSQPFTMPPKRPFLPELCQGFDRNRVMEGFGSLLSPHALTVTFGREAVKVFDMPSRRESLLLNIDCNEEMNTMEKLQNLLGQEVLVGYPYWRRARLEMLENETTKVYLNYNSRQLSKMTVPMSPFVTNTQKHAALLLQRQGIKVETVPMLAYLCLFTGMEEDKNGVLRRQYSQSAVEYPIQLLVPLRKVQLIEDPRFKERPRISSEGYGPEECCVFVRDKPSKSDRRQTDFFGGAARVICVSDKKSATSPPSFGDGDGKQKCYNIRVRLPEQIPVPQNILDYNAAGNWKSSYDVSVALGLKPNTVTILCGSCTTTPQYGSRELGLPIKFDLQSLSRVGYAKLVHKLANAERVTEYSRIAKEAPPEGHYLSPKSRSNGTDCRRRDGIWLLSSRAMKLLCDYVAAFPPVVRFIESTNGDFRSFDPMEFLRDEWANRDVEEVITEIEEFVKRSGLLDAPVMSSWEDTISLQELHDFEDQLTQHEEKKKLLAAQRANDSGKPSASALGGILLRGVSAEHLFFPASRSEGGQMISFPLKIPNRRSIIYRLGSRVVNCCVTGNVPFGATGTIIRFFYARDAEVIYDEPFVGGSRLGGRLRSDRGAVQRLHFLLPLNSPQQPTSRNICDHIIEEHLEVKRHAPAPTPADSGNRKKLTDFFALNANGNGNSAATTAATAAVPQRATPGSRRVAEFFPQSQSSPPMPVESHQDPSPVSHISGQGSNALRLLSHTLAASSPTNTWPTMPAVTVTATATPSPGPAAPVPLHMGGPVQRTIPLEFLTGDSARPHRDFAKSCEDYMSQVTMEALRSHKA